jgi:hypothetical protein
MPILLAGPNPAGPCSVDVHRLRRSRRRRGGTAPMVSGHHRQRERAVLRPEHCRLAAVAPAGFLGDAAAHLGAINPTGYRA